MPLSAGTRLGPYEIVAPIGAGGMGEVYKARDTRLDRTVAVKVLPAHVAEQADARQRFEREARAVSALNHPHICTLHDIGQQEGMHFLVMEYLDGETLSARLAKGPLPIEQVLQFARQAADALAQAHRQGVFHRDFKPGNIMLTRVGLKLLDFGLAKLKDPAQGPAPAVSLSQLPTEVDQLTQKGTILGTFQYMAPEQVEGKDTDGRSDIFAFGAVVYEMATGRKAFEGRSATSVMAAILEREVPSIAAAQPMAPPALDRVVKTCLAKDPEDRWQSARDLLRELEWIGAGEAAPAAARPIEAPAPAPAPEPKARPLGWIAATAVLAVAAIAMSGLYLLRPAPQAQTVRFTVSLPEKVTLLPLAAGGAVAVSPDGRRVAFVATDGAGRQLIWIRALDSDDARALAGTDGAALPFWSPDGRFLGFFAGGKLKKIDTSGGPAQTLADAPSGRGGAWNRDGVILFAPAPSGDLMRVSSAGGEPVPATTLEASRQENSHRWPHFLPDGRRFLYWTRSGQPESSGLYVASLDSKEKRLLLRGVQSAFYTRPGGGDAGYLLFVRERTLMAQPFDAGRAELAGEPAPVAEQVSAHLNSGWPFSASENGVVAHRSEGADTSQLGWYDRQGKLTEAVGAAGDYGRLALSPDGRTVAVERPDPQTATLDIWLLELARGAWSRFTFEPGVDWFPAWSPDGRRIAWARGVNLYQKLSSGAGPEETLLATSGTPMAHSWSADGRFFLYSNLDPKTRYDLWVVPLEGDRKPFPFLQTPLNELRGEFSPDGKWVAYTSDETGRFEIYVQKFAGGPSGAGGKWQASVNGGTLVRWRRDGKELFFVSPDRKLMAVDVAADVASFKAGVPRALFDVRIDPSIGGRGAYAVAADGRRFLINNTVEQATALPIHVIVNWKPAAR